MRSDRPGNTLQIIPHLGARDAEAAAWRLHEFDARRVPVVESLQQEEWSFQASIEKASRTRDWRGSFVDGNSVEDIGPWLRLQFLSKRQVMDDLMSSYSRIIQQARLTYANERPTFPAPNDPVCQIVLPVVSHAGFQSGFHAALAEARSHLLQTALVLQTYQLDHGTYPSRLTDLAPE